MSKYKKSNEREFEGFRLPGKYCFRRTELVNLDKDDDIEMVYPPTVPIESVSFTYPYEIEVFKCPASVFWLNKDGINTWFSPGSGTLELIKTCDLNGTVARNTASIIITTHGTKRIVCREPIRAGCDFSVLQNKRPPTTDQLRCMTFELATGAQMRIKFDKTLTALELWTKIREIQRDINLI